jgi:DNA-directed RNA polymerase specialized sigma24 family protein
LESRLKFESGTAERFEVSVDPVHLRLREALQKLRPLDREILLLVVWDQLTHAEAAQVLGCTVNAVALRLSKAKARLRDDLATAATPPLLPLNFPPSTLPLKEHMP